MNEAKRQQTIGALLRERGRLERSKDPRVEQVDAELRRLGYVTDNEPTKPARQKRPRKRGQTR